MTRRRRRRHPRGHSFPWDRIIQGTPLMIAASACPGAVVLMAYAIRNNFFPLLIEHVSTLQFIFTSCVVAFVLAVGTCIGAAALFWFVILCPWRLVLTRRLRPVARPLRQSALPPSLVPRSHFERVVWFLGSFSLFVLLALAIADNLQSHRPHDWVWVAAYFLFAGAWLLLLIWMHGTRPRTNWRLILFGPLMLVVPLVAMPAMIGPLLDLFMSTIGFRSSDHEVVLVDDEAYQSIEERAAAYEDSTVACALRLGSRFMWYLPKAS